MDKVYNILSIGHKFVHWDIASIFFDLGPSNLVIDIEHMQDQY